ncbi:MAG: hypothetical protein ACOC1K_00140 [Nanoarchaeota archaeon]
MKKKCCKKTVDENVKKLFEEDLEKLCVECEGCKKTFVLEKK